MEHTEQPKKSTHAVEEVQNALDRYKAAKAEEDIWKALEAVRDFADWRAMSVTSDAIYDQNHRIPGKVARRFLRALEAMGESVVAQDHLLTKASFTEALLRESQKGQLA